MKDNPTDFLFTPKRPTLAVSLRLPKWEPQDSSKVVRERTYASQFVPSRAQNDVGPCDNSIEAVLWVAMRSIERFRREGQ